VTDKQALKLIRGMACLRDYPKGYPDAEAKLAECLMRASDSDLKLATAIIERFDQQCPTLGELTETARQVRGNIANAGNQVQDYGEKPPILCQNCNDTGVTKSAEGYTWCICDQAMALQKELPDWLQVLNRFEKKVS
jgi:hypothetical protein